MSPIMTYVNQGSNWRWLVDRQEASKKPIRSLAFMFVAGAVGAGVFTYYAGTDHGFSASIAVGFGCGVVLLLVGLRSLGDPARVVARATKASRRMLVWCAVVALGLGLSGAVLSDWQLAASAVSFVPLAVVLLLIRRSHLS
jgi:hypothetical protein